MLEAGEQQHTARQHSAECTCASLPSPGAQQKLQFMRSQACKSHGCTPRPYPSTAAASPSSLNQPLPFTSLPPAPTFPRPCRPAPPRLCLLRPHRRALLWRLLARGAGGAHAHAPRLRAAHGARLQRAARGLRPGGAVRAWPGAVPRDAGRGRARQRGYSPGEGLPGCSGRLSVLCRAWQAQQTQQQQQRARCGCTAWLYHCPALPLPLI